jgi:hypothetical protein
VILRSWLQTIFVACDNPDAVDCFKTAGKQVEQTIQFQEFSSLLVGRDVQAFVIQGATYSVRIVTGENLIDEVSATVVEDRLILEDANTCNFVRSYGTTKVYVTAPDLKEIRFSTQFEIASHGVLDVRELRLVSENFNESNTLPLANFRMEIQAERLDIVSNNSSNFYISGEVTDLFVGFFDGVGRFEGYGLTAQHVEVSHRGSNEILVNPRQSITGLIRGTGDVLSFNRPPEIEVQELYTGRLIIND